MEQRATNAATRMVEDAAYAAGQRWPVLEDPARDATLRRVQDIIQQLFEKARVLTVDETTAETLAEIDRAVAGAWRSVFGFEVEMEAKRCLLLAVEEASRVAVRSKRSGKQWRPTGRSAGAYVVSRLDASEQERFLSHVDALGRVVDTWLNDRPGRRKDGSSKYAELEAIWWKAMGTAAGDLAKLRQKMRTDLPAWEKLTRAALTKTVVVSAVDGARIGRKSLRSVTSYKTGSGDPKGKQTKGD